METEQFPVYIEKSKYQNSKSQVLKFPGFYRISEPGFSVFK